MLDPVIFSVDILGFTLSLRWYGVLIMAGVVVGAFITTSEVKRRGGDPDWVWEGLLWVIPAGIVGARLWFVAADILGGNTRYLDNPARIVGVAEGGLRGLHIYGAILFGGMAAYVWARRRKIDMWLVLDAVAPAMLIGQAIARPANFINQELYGPPTSLPWGIHIRAENRLSEWSDLSKYPVETTRFHPTFAYEMIWNLLAGGLILWLTRRYKNKMRPGAAFALWLILAGVGRFFIEFFRPDQPRVPGTGISYTRIANVLMILAGTFILLIKYEILTLPRMSPGSSMYAIPEAEPSEVEAPGPQE